MVEKIIVENCESHERTAVRLDPHVTTIVGPNDVGKSAFLRAVWWAVANDPPGTEHIRHGATHAAVHLKVDGEWVQRYRSADENSYTFRDEVYTSLRAPSVPPKIEGFLRIGEVNFQWQMDPPFWLVETPGQLSRKLNQVVDLVTIDEMLDVARGEVGKAKTKVDLAEERVAELQKKADELAWAEAAAAALDELETAEARYAAALEAHQDLDYAIGKAELDAKLERWLTDLEPVLDRAGRTAAETVQLMADCHFLDKMVRELEAAEAALPPDVGPAWGELLARRRAADAEAERWKELDGLVRDQETAGERVCELEAELATLEERLRTETGGRCPACGKAAESSDFLPPTSTSPTPSPRPELKLVRSGFVRRPRS